MRKSLALLVVLSLAAPLPGAAGTRTRTRHHRVERTAAAEAPPPPTFLRALHAVIAHNEPPPNAAAIAEAVRRPARPGARVGHHEKLRLHLFDKVPAIARTIYDAERLTEERVMAEAGLDLFGIQAGITFSQIDTVKPRGKGELVHVVNLDGSSNLEHVAKRFEIPHGHGQRIEIQSLGLNGGEQFGFRLGGVGLTGDMLSGRAPKGMSYTLEAKVTDRTLLRWAELFAPIALEGLRHAIGNQLTEGVATTLAATVPGVSLVLAGISIRRAGRVLRSDAPTFDKALSIAHAAADVVRVVDPISGTIANAALVGLSVVVSAVQIVKLKGRLANEAREREAIDVHERDPAPHVEGDEDGDGVPDIGDNGLPQRRP